MITEKPERDWASAWPDLLAFAAGLTVAWWARWDAADLVWSLWLSSLVVGYATIVWTIFRPVVELVRGARRDHALIARASAWTKAPATVAVGAVMLIGGLFMLAFFTVHFGMFHYVHSQFLALFFPLDGGAAPRQPVGLSTYLEVARRYWWFLPSAFLAERGAFSRAGAPEPNWSATARRPGGAMLAPYRNVVRMHLLIFFFAFARGARLDNFAVYAVVCAVYFFPWRLVRRSPPAQPVPASSGP